MSCKLVNLTEQLVAREMEDLLATCHPDICQVVSSIPNGRQTLIANVLNRVDNRYVVFAENQSSSPIDLDTLRYLLEARIHIEILIYDSLAKMPEGCFGSLGCKC